MSDEIIDFSTNEYAKQIADLKKWKSPNRPLADVLFNTEQYEAD